MSSEVRTLKSALKCPVIDGTKSNKKVLLDLIYCIEWVVSDFKMKCLTTVSGEVVPIKIECWSDSAF